MLSFLNGTYCVYIEFFDKDLNIIKKKDPTKEEGEGNEIDRDVFCFKTMDVFFSMNKVPEVTIRSLATSKSFIERVGMMQITVSTINFKDAKEEEILYVTFPATPQRVITEDAWDTTWYCYMAYRPDVMNVYNNIYFVPSTYLDKKYKTEEYGEYTVLIRSVIDGKVVEQKVVKKRKKTVENNSSSGIKESATLKDAISDITKRMFHQPSDWFLQNIGNTETNPKCNITKKDALEELIKETSNLGESENLSKIRGVFFTFSKIRLLGENKKDGFKVKIIEPTGKMEENKTPTSSSQENLKLEEFETKGGKLLKDKNGNYHMVAIDKKENQNVVLINNVLNNGFFLKDALKFSYKSNSPSFLSIGDPVIVFSSFDGAKLYGGFVTTEVLHFSHYISGDYTISCSPESISVTKKEEAKK